METDPDLPHQHVFQFSAISRGKHLFTGYCDRIDRQADFVTFVGRFYLVHAFEDSDNPAMTTVCRLPALRLMITDFRIVVREVAGRLLKCRVAEPRL